MAGLPNMAWIQRKERYDMAPEPLWRKRPSTEYLRGIVESTTRQGDRGCSMGLACQREGGICMYFF